MSGVIPVLPLYAFMPWAWQLHIRLLLPTTEHKTLFSTNKKSAIFVYMQPGSYHIFPFIFIHIRRVRNRSLEINFQRFP